MKKSQLYKNINFYKNIFEVIIIKKVSDSLTYQVQIVTLEHLNGNKRIFGGTLMGWIDIVAGVTARRHSGKDVSTVAVDYLQFKKPAYRNDTILLIGYITAAFNTSMEICVETYKETLQGDRTLINKAYFVMVAIDENDKPTPVPKLELITEKEKTEYNSALQRNALRKERRERGI